MAFDFDPSGMESNPIMYAASQMAMPKMPAAGNPANAELSKMRFLSYMGRMMPRPPGAGRVPRSNGASGIGPNGAPSNFNLNDIYSPEFRDKANAMLGQYGLALPDSVGPNAILPNSGFFGNHPHLSGALEGAMLGFMGTRPSENIGEGISNALSGGLGAMGTRQSMLMNRYMAPFGVAQQMEGLEDLQQKRDLNAATIKYHTQMAQAAQDRATAGLDRAEATKPVPAFGPHGEVIGQQVWNSSTKSWQLQTGANNSSGQPISPVAPRPSGSKPPSSLVPFLGKLKGPLAWDGITPPTSDQYAAAVAAQQGNKVAVAGAMAGAGATARGKVETGQGKLSDKDKETLKTIDEEYGPQGAKRQRDSKNPNEIFNEMASLNDARVKSGQAPLSGKEARLAAVKSIADQNKQLMDEHANRRNEILNPKAPPTTGLQAIPTPQGAAPTQAPGGFSWAPGSAKINP